MKDIANFEGLYAITKDGKVWNYHKKGWQVLSQMKSKIWYLAVNLSKNNKKYCFRIHRLVAQAFIPNPLGLREVNHKNGIKNDNRIENLEWCSSSQNKKHAFENGLRIPLVGEQVGNSKYTKHLILKIRKQYSKGSTSYGKLSKKYGMCRSNVGSIILRQTWQHI